MKFRPLFLLLVSVTSLLAGCSDSNDTPSPDGTGRLVVRLTDKPFPYDLVAEANVTVIKVEARRTDDPEGMEADSTATPYVLLMEDEMDVNLLELVNGHTLELADMEVPAGTYDLIRIYVKGVNVVLTDGRSFDLKVPSGEQTGIKVLISPGLTVTGGLSADLLLDFDVSRSFVARGNLDTAAGINGFNFKPVIKACNSSTAGTLAGRVSSMEAETETGLEGAQVTVLAADTVNTTAFSDADGNYAIMGLAAGAYRVLAEAADFFPSDTLDIQIDAANVTRQDFLMEKDTTAVVDGN